MSKFPVLADYTVEVSAYPTYSGFLTVAQPVNWRAGGLPGDQMTLIEGNNTLTVEPGDGWDARITVGNSREYYDSSITLTRAQALELARWLQAKFG